MKNLSLMRHAKSSWDDLDQADFDRPLNARGQKAAPRIGQEIKKLNLKPDLILCSPSKRTRETLDLLVGSSGLSTPVTFCDSIYEASIRELKALLLRQPDDLAHILIVGHNPGMESLLTDMTGDHEHFPTAALAHMELNVQSWEKLESNKGELKWILRPKELDGDS